MGKRIKLGKTAMRVLQKLDERGPTPLSHGVRYAAFNPNLISVMSSTNHHLRTYQLVEWAGGNYDRWTVRLTDYGRECLRLGSHDPSRPGGKFADSYGPREIES